MIVPVKRADIILTHEDKIDVLLALQKQELFMIKGFNPKNSTVFNHEVLLKTQKVIKILTKHQKKKSLFDAVTVSEKEFNTFREDELLLVNKIIALENQIGECDNQISKLEDIQKSFIPFTFLSVAEEQLEKATVVFFKAFKFQSEKLEFLTSSLNTLGVDFESSLSEKTLYAVIPFYPEIASDINTVIGGAQGEEIKLPSSKLPYYEAISANKELIEETKTKRQELNSLIDQEVKNLRLIKTYYDKEANRLLREFIPHKETENFIILEGFVREDQIEKLESLLAEVSPNVELELIDNTEEVLPTALKNSKLVTPFESITNSFSVPNNKEADPNSVMSIWYWLFFGIMFADIGYGIILLIGTLVLLKFKKPRGSFKQLLQVFMYSSISTIIFGFVTGSLFGMDLIDIFPGLPNIFISAVKKPMIVLIASLVLGAFHLITALVFKSVKMIKEKDVLGALAEAVSWILIMLFGMIYIVDFLGVLWPSNAIVGYVSLGFILLGAAFIIFLSGRKAKNVLGYLGKSFGGVYSVTSYISDVLSYSRLLALMLSSAVIGSTMNLLAGMVSGALWGVGIIFSIVIIIVGHVFNFALSLLSAYVHGGRLQYLEFFGKFYEGGGIAFEPLAYELQYINEIEKEI